MKGTAMGTTFAVVGSNLVVAYMELKLFEILPKVYPREFVDMLVRNYFRFLDDVFHKWLTHFHIDNAINGLDPDLKFIMDEMTTDTNYLDVNLQINNKNELQFDKYHKPTNAFGYLKYSSCHPSHTKKNIATSLAKRIVRNVSHNRDERLEELRDHLIHRNHPENIISYAFTKVFQPDSGTINLNRSLSCNL